MTQLAETVPNTGAATSQPEQVPAESAAQVEQAPEVWTGHPIDIRLTLPSFLGRYYLTVVVGKERRNDTRLVSDRVRHPLDKRWNIAIGLFVGVVVGLALYGLTLTLGLWAIERLLMVS